jgi:hypothetical protein
MKLYLSILVVAGLLCSGCPHHALTDTPAVERIYAEEVLPVKRVVMFQNGVAYIERRGEFQGDELVMRVRPSQIQDILKSITVVDFSGGRANSLAMPVDVSSQRALSELPKLELGHGSLGAILRALRGAEVHLVTDDGTFEGRMVGIDAMGTAEKGQQISILDESGTVRIVPVDEVEALKILDTTLANGLVKGLDISLGKEAWRSVELKVFLNKDANPNRDLLVSYLVEMPTWKSTYRLVLEKQNEPLLQGWAVIDNVSGADWKDVKLTLTTGSPVSFHYNLYTPRFVSRPDLTPYHTLGIAPPVAESTLAVAPPPPPPGRYSARRAKDEKKKRKRGYGGRSRRAAPASKVALGDADYDDVDEYAPEEPEMGMNALYDSMRVQAKTQKVGSLYRFDLEDPMTVPNRSSTMIALINTRIPGKAIYSYNPQSGVRAAVKHPFRAVAIRNQAGSVLEPGPMAIIRNGQYVGEGLIQRIEKGQDSYISYALDTAVNVTASTSSGHEVAGLMKISRGVIQTKSFSIYRHNYEVQASKEDGEAIPLLVNIPKRPGWELEAKGGKKESETASRLYYSMPVKPGEKTKLEIKEKYPTFNSYRILDHGAQQALMLYIEAKDADEKIVTQLKPLVTKIKKLSDTNTKIRTLERKRSDLQQRASEIRANLKLLKKSRNVKLKKEQQARLMKVDRKLSKLTDQLVSLRDKAAQYKVELSTLVEKLEIKF